MTRQRTESKHKRYRDRLTLNKKCRRCARPLWAEATFKHCTTCRALFIQKRKERTRVQKSKYVKTYRLRQRERGLCIKCPQPVEKPHVYCDVHRKKLADWCWRKRGKFTTRRGESHNSTERLMWKEYQASPILQEHWDEAKAFIEQHKELFIDSGDYYLNHATDIDELADRI